MKIDIFKFIQNEDLRNRTISVVLDCIIMPRIICVIEILLFMVRGKQSMIITLPDTGLSAVCVNLLGFIKIVRI